MFLITYRDPKTFKPVKKRVRLKFIGKHEPEEIKVYIDSSKFARFTVGDYNWLEILNRAKQYALKTFGPKVSCPVAIKITSGWY
ncbi:hypothetical protein LCGC14_1532850 [marine sediment metagenome]|uniref:Uncharacterized protein n=1 Tax=marine sediment metagenome TaxID=412755 RepID=A0A0F9JG84_9ZZZZ